MKKLKERNNTKNHKHITNNKNKTSKILTIAVILIIIIAIIVLILFSIFNKKVKDTVQIELGTETLNIQDFVTDEKYVDDAEFITDISQIDLSKVGTYEIIINYKNKV